MPELDKNILIVGLGSEILCDDGVGSRMVKALEEKFDKNTVDWLYVPIISLDVIEILHFYKTVILVDAVCTNFSQPGKLSIAKADRFSEALHIDNEHEGSFWELLNTWRVLGYKLPEQLFLASIGVSKTLEFGAEFSTMVQSTFEQNLKKLHEFVEHVLQAKLNPEQIKYYEQVV